MIHVRPKGYTVLMGLLFGRKDRGTTIIARFTTSSNRAHMLTQIACAMATPRSLHDLNPHNLDSHCKPPG